MRPKNPTPKLPGTSHSHPDTPHPLPIPRFEPPVVIRPGGPDIYQSDRQLAPLPPPDNQLPTVHIHDLPPSVMESGTGPTSDPRSTESIRLYVLPPQTRTLLPDVNTDGLRVYRGRIYAEVQYTTTGTVMVAWDDSLGTYRAMFPQEAQPSGPALHFDPVSNTWRDGESQTTPLSTHRAVDNFDESLAQTSLSQPKEPTRATPDKATSYINTQHYVWNEAANNHHGYVVMHRKMRLKDSDGPLQHHAFRDENGSFVSVEPSAPRIDEPAKLLPAWTDRDIWDLYGLQGADITRFRNDAHNTGKKPQWATVRPQRMENIYLFDELRRWSGLIMDRDKFNEYLHRQNRTPAQWVERLESVTLHHTTPDTQAPLPRLPTPDTPDPQTPSPRLPTPDTPDPQTPLPRLPTPDTPAPQTPLPRLPTPGIPETIVPPSTYGHQSHYTWNLDSADTHGYVKMQRKPGLDDRHGPLTQVAFAEGTALTIVRPVTYSARERAFRPYWRDIDIWNLYRIEGEDILRFRRDVALRMKEPEWVIQRDHPSRREQLIDYLRLWTNPDSPLKSKEQVLARFQPYNLSTLQLARLSKEISPTGQFKHLINDDVPAWVTTHQARTRLVTNTKLFDPFLPEMNAEIMRLRNRGEGTSILKATLTKPFFQELLRLCGYQRNGQDYLYRTDIPAVFKADERTPFDIARPAAMVPQKVSARVVTTETPVSAMFSLKAAMDFANEVKDVTGSNYTQPKDPLTGNESHQTSSGASTPHAQRILFCYLLDTRNIEVVPGQENRAYNSARLEQSSPGDSTWFPSMRMEGHVSTSPIGFTSRRVWLVNSAMTRAATVEDVHLQALAHATGSNQTRADAIQARTKAGALNRNEYDALIDEVANAGKRILELPTGNAIFSNDIEFPPEIITL